jgi:hypothetical protein
MQRSANSRRNSALYRGMALMKFQPTPVNANSL